MDLTTLEARVRQSGELSIIDLRGDIDGFGEETLNRAYEDAVSTNPSAVLLNFREVGYINSKGIALIVTILAQARKSGRRLLTSGLSEHYLEIFQITRLADFMTIFPDEATALQSVAHPA